jgi:hypothetical protein
LWQSAPRIVMQFCMPFTASQVPGQLLVCISQTKATYSKPPWLLRIQICRQQEHLLATYGNIHGAGQQQQQPAAAAAGPGGLADEQQQQQDALDDSLAQHFASIQELSDRQALEELLPRLQQVVGQVGTGGGTGRHLRSCCHACSRWWDRREQLGILSVF